MPNDNAGANKNLMLLNTKTINILRNPDTVCLIIKYNAYSSGMLSMKYYIVEIMLNGFKSKFSAQMQGRRHHLIREQCIPGQ